MDNFLSNIILSQTNLEKNFEISRKKSQGIFFTNDLKIIDNVLDIIEIDTNLINKRFLEPSVGNGIFILRLIYNIFAKFPSKDLIDHFINHNLFFLDIDHNMISITENNISKLYKYLFNHEYTGNFNSFVYDFTKKISYKKSSLFDNNLSCSQLTCLLNSIDFVLGNPPFVSLYGRRDKKINEQQRIDILSQYSQFPPNLLNGKINYVMLFLEHSLDFLKEGGKLGFILDISFFETAFKYTRRFLLQNTKIISIDTNISLFDGVASGQIILKLEKTIPNKDHYVLINDYSNNNQYKIKQSNWFNHKDEYKFRFNFSNNVNTIMNLINSQATYSLKTIYPHKNLRTCVMPLDMEDLFVDDFVNPDRNCKYYKYYQGSKSLSGKYCRPISNKYFYYDKPLQDKINDELKDELTKKGIKNKKRIGLGEEIVYANPKIYIRQSAKEIIATYDETLSSANNSLYVFTLRNDSDESKKYLKYLCGYLNSELITFYAQNHDIIRYRKGKQPQIKIADLYSVPVICDNNIQENISSLVEQIYDDSEGVYKRNALIEMINNIIYDYYKLSLREREYVKTSILNYLKA